MAETDGRLEQATAALLAPYQGPVAVMSFNPHCIARMAALAPTLPRGLTTSAYDPADWHPLPPKSATASAPSPITTGRNLPSSATNTPILPAPAWPNWQSRARPSSAGRSNPPRPRPPPAASPRTSPSNATPPPIPLDAPPGHATFIRSEISSGGPGGRQPPGLAARDRQGTCSPRPTSSTASPTDPRGRVGRPRLPRGCGRLPPARPLHHPPLPRSTRCLRLHRHRHRLVPPPPRPARRYPPPRRRRRSM
jgi:hypothetical protein